MSVNVYQVTPSSSGFIFRTERKVPKLGVMLVGWGGNNGTTVTAAVLANKLGLTWKNKNGVQVKTSFGFKRQGFFTHEVVVCVNVE